MNEEIIVGDTVKAVITGDIVGSSQIKEEWRDALLLALRDIACELRGISELQMEMFRGDSFQIVVHSPSEALLMAVLMRAGLMSRTPEGSPTCWDARLSVGIGEVSFHTDSVLVSDGEAFRYSGKELDEMGKRRLMVRTRWKEVNDELRVSTAFADELISHWSKAQAEAIYISLLHGISQKDVAERLHKSPQAVSKLLGNAKETLIRSYLDRYKTIITQHMRDM